MGKRFSPAYANIYMADWEESAFLECPKLPIIYLRYLDDIWGIWTHTREDFQHFVTNLNNHHPSINLQPVLHCTEINFLDTTTFKGPNFPLTGQLDVRVYFKPTDAHALLHETSFHPRHTFRGIIYSQLLRFQRICTRAEDRNKATETLFQAMRKRGYSRTFLRKIRKQVLENNQPTRLIQESCKSLIPIVSVYSSHSVRAHGILKNNFQTLMQNTKFQEHFKILSAHKKNPNLQDLLIKARLPPITPGPVRTNRLQIITNHQTGTRFLTQRGVTLSTLNCIYLLYCKKCHKQYVGETKNSLRTRLHAHRHNISRNRKKGTPLVQHFQQHGLENLGIVGLESRAGWSCGERKFAERKWIRKLDCFFPKGLNQA